MPSPPQAQGGHHQPSAPPLRGPASSLVDDRQVGGAGPEHPKACRHPSTWGQGSERATGASGHGGDCSRIRPQVPTAQLSAVDHTTGREEESSVKATKRPAVNQQVTQAPAQLPRDRGTPHALRADAGARGGVGWDRQGLLLPGRRPAEGGSAPHPPRVRTLCRRLSEGRAGGVSSPSASGLGAETPQGPTGSRPSRNRQALSPYSPCITLTSGPPLRRV